MCARLTSAFEMAADADPELAWVRLTECGASEVNAAQLAAAGESWRRASRIAEGFADGDPRLGASLNNLAVLACVGERLADADRLFHEALRAWAAARGWIERMQLAPRARSSLFHLRMELRHRHHYARLALNEQHALLSAGRAVTLHNRAQWCACAGRQADAESLYRTALRDRQAAFGESEHAVAVMRDRLAAAQSGGSDEGAAPSSRGVVWASALIEPFIVQAEREGWVIDRPAEFTDEGRLMAGLICACLIERPIPVSGSATIY